MSIERYNVRAGVEIHLGSCSYGRTFVKHDYGSIFKRYVTNIALVKFGRQVFKTSFLAIYVRLDVQAGTSRVHIKT
jgi:hypothetical protein